MLGSDECAVVLLHQFLHVQVVPNLFHETDILSELILLIVGHALHLFREHWVGDDEASGDLPVRRLLLFHIVAEIIGTAQPHGNKRLHVLAAERMKAVTSKQRSLPDPLSALRPYPSEIPQVLRSIQFDLPAYVHALLRFFLFFLILSCIFPYTKRHFHRSSLCCATYTRKTFAACESSTVISLDSAPCLRYDEYGIGSSIPLLKIEKSRYNSDNVVPKSLPGHRKRPDYRYKL